MGAHEEVMEQVDGRNLEEMAAGETKVAMTVGGDRSRSNHEGIQNAAGTMAHGEVEGGSSHVGHG